MMHELCLNYDEVQIYVITSQSGGERKLDTKIDVGSDRKQGRKQIHLVRLARTIFREAVVITRGLMGLGSIMVARS